MNAIIIAKNEEIECLTKSMEAVDKLMKLEQDAGSPPKVIKDLFNQYHRLRIQREILIGNLPKPDKETPKKYWSMRKTMSYC